MLSSLSSSSWNVFASACLATVLGASGPATAASPARLHLRTRLPPLTLLDLAAPEPLSRDEEVSPTTNVLARRFNPAMAFPTRDIWPVEVRYAWHDGSDLRARTVGPTGRVVAEYVARPREALAGDEWGELPDHDPNGHGIEYFVDAPGDDRMEAGVSGWRRRWRTIMGGDASTRESPRAGDYPPTQYAHLFWFNRAKGLLGVQYWFFYPYNEWINHHEGDWERINVILRGPSRLHDRAAFRVVGYQFFFHRWTAEPEQVVRMRGRAAKDDHVVVWAGGESRFLLWSGSQSGGSYPLPALWPAVGGGIGGWRPAEDTRRSARFIRAEDFKIVVLPEPFRLDTAAHPELSWLQHAFFAGQPRMYGNPLKLNHASFGQAPQQPARQCGWNARENPPYFRQPARFDRTAMRLPRTWRATLATVPRVCDAAQPSSLAAFRNPTGD